MTRISFGSHTIQHFLGVENADLDTPVPGLGTIWDVGIAGDGYLYSTLGTETPFEYRAITVRGAPQQKPRIDMAGEPGEQTLEQWWARAQHSWHGGAGQRIFDSIESDRSKFWASKGVNIWTKGQVSLLRKTFIMETSDFNDLFLISSGGYLFLTERGLVTKVTDIDTHPTGSTSSTMGGPTSGTSLIQSITSDGEYIYACWDPAQNAGIRRQAIDLWAGGTLVNDLDPDLIEHVKSRLIAAKGPSLYDVIPGDTAAPDPLYTQPIGNWVWSSISGSATSIYVSGYSGERSEIYAMRLDATDLQAGMVMGVPTSVWQAPDGEVIHCIKGYLGKALLIGTSRGLRIGLVANVEGELDVSQLLVETPTGFPVKAIEPQGDYAWFGWSSVDGDSGLGRIDLGTLAYATDIMADGIGNIKSIAAIQERMVFSQADMVENRIIAEHLTDLVDVGWYDTGEIRFDTFENKNVQFFDALISGFGTFDAEVRKNLDATFTKYLDDYPIGEITEALGIIASRFSLRITLNKDSEQDDRGPTQLEWRLRATPHAIGTLEYMLPLMTYDFLVARNEQHIGYIGMSKFMRERLTALWKDKTHFTFESREFGTFKAEITGIEYKSFTPPRGADGMGGITLVIIREQQ